ncbi:preprotein translocase subunit SecG [Patescibacteria group bacterium]|nr:preprotein translocase subunit SecG [Patescibacteria group bacterium]
MLGLNIALIIVSIGLVGSILLQSRSAGLGGAFGGSSDGFHVRRGSEKRIFQISVVLSILFMLIAAAHLFI